MSSPTWFSRPSRESPGRLNLVYDALDRQVIGGRAEAAALRASDGDVSYADLLEQVAAIGGLLRALGVREGDAVAVSAAPSPESLVALLAVARIGAVGWLGDAAAALIDACDPALVVADGDQMPEVADAVDALDPSRPRAVVVVRPGDWQLLETRDVAWAPALKAGATDPASVAPVAGGTALAVVGSTALPHDHADLAGAGDDAVVGDAWDTNAVIAVYAALTSGRGVDLTSR